MYKCSNIISNKIYSYILYLIIVIELKNYFPSPPLPLSLSLLFSLLVIHLIFTIIICGERRKEIFLVFITHSYLNLPYTNIYRIKHYSIVNLLSYTLSLLSSFYFRITSFVLSAIIRCLISVKTKINFIYQKLPSF